MNGVIGNLCLRLLVLVLLALMAAPVTACTPQVRYMEPARLAALIAQDKAGSTFNLVDLRNRQAYRTLHIPGALNIPYEALASDRTLYYDSLPVVFYDHGEPDVRRLKEGLGSRLPGNVVVLSGGFRRWLKNGLPVRKGGT